MLLLALQPANLNAKRFFKKAAKTKKNLTQPEVRIPVEALGYTPPGRLPAFDSQALVGVYFIDANHLLFTFNLKGLQRRDDSCSTADSQRIVRAVVLDLPSGKVEKQADWELYDFADYLWNLGNGQFLLRRCSQLDLVSGGLDLHPLIDAQGAIDGVGFSPDRSMIVLERSGQGPASPQKSAFPFENPPAQKVDVEFIQLHPLAVLARTQIPSPAMVPIVAQGILEVLTAPQGRWIADIQPFQGAERKIMTMYSACTPRLTALTNTMVVAGTCSSTGDGIFQAFDLNGLLLWQIPLGSDRHYPQFLLTRNGAHFAIESLHATQPLASLDPLSSKVVDAELIDIYDTLTGVRIGGFRTTPVYTAGKNADFSPDGTRMAVLHDGAIEIYTLKELAKTLQ